MSPLEWALVLQAIYFFGLHFVKNPRGESWGKIQLNELNDDPTGFLIGSVLGIHLSFPLLFTLLSLVLYPTPWVFIWLVGNVLFFLLGGIASKPTAASSTAVITSIIGFVILLINLKLAAITREKPTLVYPTTNSTLTQTSSDNGLWFLPLKVLIVLASVIGILLLLRWAIEKLFPTFNTTAILEKTLIAVVSGVVVTSLVYYFFGDPTVATVPGLAAAAGLYLLNRQG